MTEQRQDRPHKEYRGLRLDQAKRLKELERENARLKARVTELASAYGWFGDRRVTGLLHAEDWRLSHRRVVQEYNRRRPHSALGYLPPAPGAAQVAVGLT